MNPVKTFQALEKNKRWNLILLFVTALLFWISLTTLLPTLPVYTEDLGGTRQQVGFVMGAFAIGLLGSRLWLGQLVDQRGRKIAILIGTLVAAIAPMGYLFVNSIPLLMMIRAFHGISVAAFTTGYNALVVDLSPPEQRGELIGYMSLTIPLGMALGPAVGGYLAELAGYPTLFWTTAALGWLTFILSCQVREVPLYLLKKATETLTHQENRTVLQILGSPSLLIPSLVLLLVGLVFGNLLTFLPLFMREIHLPLNAGLFYTVSAMSSFVGRFWTGQASDLYGRGIFVSGSLICYIAAMLMLAWADTPSLFLIAGGLEGIGSGIVIPMIIALVSDRSGVEERGKAFSVCISGLDVGTAIAGPFFGWLGEIVGYRGLFQLSSVLSLCALVLFATQGNPSVRSSWKFALGQEQDRYAN